MVEVVVVVASSSLAAAATVSNTNTYIGLEIQTTGK
jgi:hypothetical protein